MKLRLLTLAIGLGCGVAWAADTGAPAPHLTPIAPGNATAPGAKTGEAGGPAQSQTQAGPHVTAFAPLAYFNEKCARCHGEYGSFYGDDFAKGRDDASLHAIVAEMANGPAQAPLAPADLEVVTAWHRAFRDKKPFVAVVKSEKTADGWQLSGEVSPGATLEINGESVEVHGSDWTHSVTTASAAGALKLRAQKADVATELDANAAAFSSEDSQNKARANSEQTPKND